MQLLETIKVDQGKPFFISFHNERFNSSRQALFGINKKIDLSTLINPPDLNCYRCRIVYSEKIEKIEFIPCQNRQFKTFQIVYDDEIKYNITYSLLRTVLLLLISPYILCTDGVSLFHMIGRALRAWCMTELRHSSALHYSAELVESHG